MSTCDDEKSAIVKRINRVEGQVRGIGQMVENDRYCLDILHQVSAIRAALGRVEDDILKRHAAHCVEEAIMSGKPGEQREKFNELIDLMRKTKR